MSDLRRRDFITFVGGVAAAWPLAARAQQPAMPVIGFLHAASPETAAHNVAAFRQGLKENGYVEGQNVAIEYRWAEGRADRYPELVADLVRRKVNVIVTGANTLAARAAKAATSTIPIVFGVAEDPVKLGLVASLARPGGNATGVNIFLAELAAKRLGLLHEMVPRAARVAVLVNPSSKTTAESTVQDVQAAAPVLGLQIQLFSAGTIREIDAVYASLARERVDALFVGPDPFFSSRRVHLALEAARHAVPATYAGRHYVEAGGLMSYGPNPLDTNRQNGVYAGRILRGEKPRGPSGGPADQVRAGDQRSDREVAPARNSAGAARPRRRGDRMM
jgi:putative ABC transport system substrate-binding protein